MISIDGYQLKKMHYQPSCEAPPSSVAAEAPVLRWGGHAVIGATTTPRILSKQDFVQVQQAWAVRDDDFRALLAAYKATVRKLKVKPTLKRWNIPTGVLSRWAHSDRPRILQMQRMSHRCLVRCIYSQCII